MKNWIPVGLKQNQTVRAIPMPTRINNVMTSLSQVFFLPNVFLLAKTLREFKMYEAAKFSGPLSHTLLSPVFVCDGSIWTKKNQLKQWFSKRVGRSTCNGKIKLRLVLRPCQKISCIYRVFFSTGPPPKKLKYGKSSKARLGVSRTS